MKIEKRKVNELHFYSGNPRKISNKMLENLKKSISEFGIVDPLVINKDNQVIGGNQRLKALQDMKIEEVDVVVVDFSKSKEKALNIALNKIAGEFDEDLLKSFIEDMEPLDLELTGLDDKEISLLDNIETQEDEYKEPDDLNVTVKRNEIYQLGNHRLMCGDATSIEDMKKLIGNNDIKLCFTSPPYNMAGNRYRNYDDNLKSQEYIDFNINTIKNIRPYLKGYLFWNISYNKNSRWEWIEIFYRITKETGINFLEKIVWDKGHGIPITSKKQLTRQYEDIYLGGTETEIENELTEAYLGTTLKNYAFNKRTGKGITNYWRITTGNTQTKEHSACFPVPLPVKAILLMTIHNENVLDPFIGLGSTLIACEKTKRNCFGMEIDPYYCQVIIDRWEKFTGKVAVKITK